MVQKRIKLFMPVIVLKPGVLTAGFIFAEIDIAIATLGNDFFAFSVIIVDK